MKTWPIADMEKLIAHYKTNNVTQLCRLLNNKYSEGSIINKLRRLGIKPASKVRDKHYQKRQLQPVIPSTPEKIKKISDAESMVEYWEKTNFKGRFITQEIILAYKVVGKKPVIL